MSDFQDSPKILVWIANMTTAEYGEMDGTDFILNEKGGRRFSLGVANKNPLLCWLKVDSPALESIKWTSAAFIFGLKNKDWIALSCQDIRVKNSNALNPVRFRLFVPITVGRLDPWISINPANLSIGRSKMEKGSLIQDGEPFMELPLKVLKR